MGEDNLVCSAHLAGRLHRGSKTRILFSCQDVCTRRLILKRPGYKAMPLPLKMVGESHI